MRSLSTVLESIESLTKKLVKPPGPKRKPKKTPRWKTENFEKREFSQTRMIARSAFLGKTFVEKIIELCNDENHDGCIKWSTPMVITINRNKFEVG